MSQISGYVKEIYEGTTKTGRSAGKPFWSITLDTDAKLTCFNADFMRGVVEELEYTFTYEKSGDYINLTAPSVPVISVDSETTSPDSTTAPLVDEPLQKDTGTWGKSIVTARKDAVLGTDILKRERAILGTANKDEAIRKAVALKAAVEFATATLGGTSNIEDVIDFAIKFEKYLK